jgi:hypothetical protein
MERTRIAAFTMLLPVLGSCNGDEPTHVALEEYLVDVSCDASGTCRGADGEVATGNWVEARAIASATASAFRPHGTYMYIDYMRGPTFVELELDFPTDIAGEVPVSATMREWEDGALAFESDAASGVIQMAPPGGSNRIPSAGGFNVRFASFGPDGERSTEDDEVREIRNGRFQLDHAPAAEPYDPATHESYWDDPDFGVVVEIWVYPDGEYDDTYYEDDYYESGCGSDEYYGEDAAHDDTYDSGGCEGDTYEEDPYADSGGCDSDDWSSSEYDSGGCEGDTYDEEAGGYGCDCEGDSAVTARGPGRRAFALFVPAFAIFLTRSVLRRRK